MALEPRDKKNTSDDITLAVPQATDAAAVHLLIQNSPPLDTNSLYCNLLQTSHFANTAIIAKMNSEVVGFVSGYGLPFAITLLRPELDNWEPAEHNGTFRGNNLAFIAARIALEKYWQDGAFSEEIKKKSEVIEILFQRIIDRMDEQLTLKGRGMMRGKGTPNGDIASAICKHAFAKGLIVETSGSWGEVVKCLCPLTIPMDDLHQGLDILEEAFEQVLNHKHQQAKAS